MATRSKKKKKNHIISESFLIGQAHNVSVFAIRTDPFPISRLSDYLEFKMSRESPDKVYFDNYDKNHCI